MISRVMDGYTARDPVVSGALREIATYAEPMAAALRSGNLPEVGRLLSGNWSHQIALDPGMKTADMSVLEEAMNRAGSLGGKAAGAGAGGCMFFICEEPERARSAARDAGALVIPCAWTAQGVEAWAE